MNDEVVEIEIDGDILEEGEYKMLIEDATLDGDDLLIPIEPV